MCLISKKMFNDECYYVSGNTNIWTLLWGKIPCEPNISWQTDYEGNTITPSKGHNAVSGAAGAGCNKRRQLLETQLLGLISPPVLSQFEPELVKVGVKISAYKYPTAF